MPAKSTRRRRRGLTLKGRLFGWAIAGFTFLFVIYLTVLFVIITARFEGKRWRLPSKVYTNSFILYPGLNIREIKLMDRLKHLGYTQSGGTPARPGTFHPSSSVLELYLNEFKYPDHHSPSIRVDIRLEENRITEIEHSETGESLPLLELEPELIDAFYDQTWEERELVRLEEVSPNLTEAVIAMEDTRFYSHHGLDFRGIARAFLANLKAGAIVQGGSTLTQQLVKNFYLNQERTLTRKINEAFMSILLELRYEKSEILEAYLNEIYMAQSGSMGIFGMGQASLHYFGKSPRDLTRGEAALLAGMIRSPNLYSPFNNPDRAQVRRGVVLKRMEELELITPEERTRALNEIIPTHPPAKRDRFAPYFVDFVRNELSENYPAEVLTSEGLRIFTTIDPGQQREAEGILSKGLSDLEEKYPGLKRENPADQIQSSLIALQPQTGHIRAMVGGRDYSVSQFNRVVQAKRQPGSLFKPFVYAAAITKGKTELGEPYTPATLIDDSPIELFSEQGPWMPQNYDKVFHGPVTLRTALQNSLNVATVRLAEQVGIPEVIRAARAMGVESPLQNLPSLALGTSEVKPLEMALAYSTIANGGIRVEPIAIKEVVYTNGQVLERRTIEMERVLSRQQAYILTSLLEGVVQEGTARRVRWLGFDRPAAGKTGTTSHYKDAWFIGFTPDLLGLVWVGFDRNTLEESGEPAGEPDAPTPGLSGAQAALPIWTAFMKKATAGTPIEEFSPPEGVVFKSIDPESGLLSGADCPKGYREVFIEGTAPKRTCSESREESGGVIRWFKDLMGSP